MKRTADEKRQHSISRAKMPIQHHRCADCENISGCGGIFRESESGLPNRSEKPKADPFIFLEMER
ncbi:MAG: hypothetical protein C4530_20110 [Desulfobacteraceae bacterium]|nr:MAG: hypothetical protein C4530_20110 [Desulfobacteraceae bacterium]